MMNRVGSAALEATIASFIVWLARQRAPLPGRCHSSTTVERFLRWQQVQRDLGTDHTEDSYCAQLRRTGAGDAEVATIHAAIDQFRRYLRTAS